MTRGLCKRKPRKFLFHPIFFPLPSGNVCNEIIESISARTVKYLLSAARLRATFLEMTTTENKTLYVFSICDMSWGGRPFTHMRRRHKCGATFQMITATFITNVSCELLLSPNFGKLCVRFYIKHRSAEIFYKE